MAEYIKIGEGKLMWVSSKTPRAGKYGNKYEASIILPKEEALKFNSQFDAALEEFKKSKIFEFDPNHDGFGEKMLQAFKVKYPFYENKDENGQPNGEWIARASAREFLKKGEKQINNKPDVVDGAKMPIDTEVANGSIGYLVVQARPWALTMDVKTISMPLWLEAIQVTKLIPYTGSSDPLDVL